MSLALCLVAVFALSLLPSGSVSLRLYPFPQEPEANPDYARYAVKHPTMATFGNKTRFATLRGFQIDESSAVVNYSADLTKFCLDPNTSQGSVVWPMYPLLYTTNFEAVVDAIAQAQLYVTDIWAFVPGSGPGDGSMWREDTWQQFYPPPPALDYLESKLGERWLGMDIGEQDGRYIGSYASQAIPLSLDRRGQFLNFREHFKGMEDILGPRLVSLISLTFPHYMAKTGLYTMIGAEAAQALPNAQVFYAFLRGAGKQYGVLWFGNVSVYSRFGYKTYPTTASMRTPLSNYNKGTERSTHNLEAAVNCVSRNYTCHSQGDGGPTCGTSLNLMKRLMYAQLMYGSGYVSFENGWFVGNTATLSPIGKIQNAAKEFVNSLQGPLGVQLSTVGLYLDFFTGFCPPRHLYSGNLYRSWGNLPYSDGDFLADDILRIVYPQYQDSSYFHDETGFSSPTPYGDTVDVLLSDTPLWTMNEYNTIVVASNLTGQQEVKDNLEQFVYQGGQLVITAGNVAQLPHGLLGVHTNLDCKVIKFGAEVEFLNGQKVIEGFNMSVCDLQYPPNCTVLAKLSDSTPLAVQLSLSSGGSLTVFATPFAISSNPVAHPASKIDITLSSPYPMLDHARLLMHIILTNATLFTTSANLTVLPTYIGKDQFYLLVSNPELRQQPLKLLSPQGVITNVEEIALDQSEKGAVGYLPDGYQGTDLGHSTNTTIAGVDTRLFKVTLSSQSLQFLPKAQPKPRPIGVSLHLRRIDHSIRHEILLRPTFFQHYDSVVVDYSYLITKDQTFLKQERDWLQKQSVTVHVDASPSIDLFPKLRLINNSAVAFNQSYQSILALMEKMAALGSPNLILSLHRYPENNFSPIESLTSFNNTLRLLSGYASKLGIELHIQDAVKNPLGDELALSAWLNASGLGTLKIVLNTAILLSQELSPAIQTLIAKQSSFIFVNAPVSDIFGSRYSVNVPVTASDPATQNQLQALVRKICSLRGYCPYGDETVVYPLVMDAYFTSADEEYMDVRFLENLLFV